MPCKSGGGTPSSPPTKSSSLSTWSRNMKDSTTRTRSLSKTSWSPDRSTHPPYPDKPIPLESTSTQKMQNPQSQKVLKKLSDLASFVPDFILKIDESSFTPPHKAIIKAIGFIIDVSGFTALTEAYSLKGKGGTDQLTKTLSTYLTPLAECILLCNGDIVKYAGDAFLAYWKVDKGYEFPECLQKVVDCALYIQETYGSFLAREVNITIKVKIGIGVGPVYLCSIGTETYQHYVAFGPGVESAAEAEKHCSSGQVVLHPRAWRNYCNPNHYKVEWMGDGFRGVQRITTFINPNKRGRPSLLPQPNSPTTVRPLISDLLETKSESFLRRFLLSPVLTKLDDDIPLEYLNESRLICIAFIHVDITPKGPTLVLEIVNTAFIKIHNIASRLQGALTKCVMFDKGLTYLLAFGLPGYINENQCAHALKFSHLCRQTLLSSVPGIEEVSIGVTTGPCFTGVIGHARRQEYTLMGRKVNKAARLMTNYHGKICCDQETNYHSKLSQRQFQLQEEKGLKGIANPGKIYEFLGTTQESQEDDDKSGQGFMYPMVGREKEVSIFKETLTNNMNELIDQNKVQSLVQRQRDVEPFISQGTWMLIFEGEHGMGKSRLLSECLNEATSLNIPVFNLDITLMNSGQLNYGLKTLMMDALGLSGFRGYQEREDFLRRQVQDPELASELSILNDILRTKFPLNPKYALMENSAIQANSKQVLIALLKSFYPQDLIMLAVDDAHFLDPTSWDFLQTLSKSPHIFTVLTLRRNASGAPKLPEAISNSIYHNKNIEILHLSGLDTIHCKTLACQLTEVSGISSDLEKILVAKSQGVPAWIDQVLHELIRTGILSYSSSILLEAGLSVVYTDPSLLQKVEKTWKRQVPRAWDNEENEISTLIPQTASRIQESQSHDEIQENPLSRLLTIKVGTNIKAIQISGTLHENLIDQYDELSSSEQLILKCGCVLGKRFSRSMMSQILPNYEQNKSKYDESIKQLMIKEYLQCASRMGKSSSNPPKCYCKIPETFEKFKNCKFLEFRKDMLAEVIYNLLTHHQLKAFHLKAAQYLDNQGEEGPKCEFCSGQNTAYLYGFILKSNEMLDSEAALKASLNKRHREETLTFDQLKKGKRRASLQTQVFGIKQKYQNDGTKITKIDYDVISLLRRIQRKRILFCCSKKNEVDEELDLLRDDEDQTVINLDKFNEGGTGDTPGYQRPTGQVDLRLCECIGVQAKINIDMVKHYSVAEKYGKCMLNLLQAAFNTITIGNGSQGLIHLEDAATLLTAIQQGTLPRPEPEDVEDSVINDEDIDYQITYLNGLAYFEIGNNVKAKHYFTQALSKLGIDFNFQQSPSTFNLNMKLWRSKHCRGCQKWKKTTNWSQALQTLNYLQQIFKEEKKLDLSLLTCIYQVLLSEYEGDIVLDIIPAYTNLLSTLTLMGYHKKSKGYEKRAISLIHETFNSDLTLDPSRLLSTSLLLQSVSYSHLVRGELQMATDSAYLSLRLGQTLNDSSLMVHLLPTLIITLLFSLKIPEIIQALQKLWFIADEEEDWPTLALYFSMCLDLLLRTSYPLESFISCENFVVKNSNWESQGLLFRADEVQCTLESSLSLFYARIGNFDEAKKWIDKAINHRPKSVSTLLSVSADLKIIESQLIITNHYLELKKYSNYSTCRSFVKKLIKEVSKSLEIVPVMGPRFHHLVAYYHKIRSRNKDADKSLRKAEKMASRMDNKMELEWIGHSRSVWEDKATPTVKFLWLEHCQGRRTLDWHAYDQIPWADVMYSLPIPTLEKT